MDKPKSIERIERMRKGEKIKCPKCDSGFFSAVGDKETTYLFRCDKCGTSIVETRNLNFKSILSK